VSALTVEIFSVVTVLAWFQCILKDTVKDWVIVGTNALAWSSFALYILNSSGGEPLHRRCNARWHFYQMTSHLQLDTPQALVLDNLRELQGLEGIRVPNLVDLCAQAQSEDADREYNPDLSIHQSFRLTLRKER
jgi:hypothetical protein